MSSIVAQGSVPIVDGPARPIVTGSTFGRVRVTVRNAGPFEVRVGGDETISYGVAGSGFASSLGNWTNIPGASAPNGYPLAPDEHVTFTQDGMEAVYAVAVPGTGLAGQNAPSGQPAGTVSPSMVSYLVETVDASAPTERLAY